MRTLLPIVALIAAAPLAGGCTENCGPPQQLNGRQYEVFTHAVSWEITNEPFFPGESSPANGLHTWQFDWSSPAAAAPVTVYTDGQVFEGDGNWDEQECGTFFVTWSGIYEAGDGATHAFAAASLFRFWPGELVGFLDWDETWRAPNGEVGSYSADAQMRGTGP